MIFFSKTFQKYYINRTETVTVTVTVTAVLKTYENRTEPDCTEILENPVVPPVRNGFELLHLALVEVEEAATFCGVREDLRDGLQLCLLEVCDEGDRVEVRAPLLQEFEDSSVGLPLLVLKKGIEDREVDVVPLGVEEADPDDPHLDELWRSDGEGAVPQGGVDDADVGGVEGQVSCEDDDAFGFGGLDVVL